MVTCGTETPNTHVRNSWAAPARTAPPCLIQTHTSRTRNHTQSRRVDVSNRVGARPSPHRGSSAVSVADRRSSGVGQRVLSDSSGAGGGSDRARALPTGTRPRAAAGCSSHVQLLLVAEQKIAASEASGALRAFEGLLLGVGPFVSLEVFQSRERALTGPADVWSRFVGLWWRAQLRLSSSRGLRATSCNLD
jgi:hypothetical protein